MDFTQRFRVNNGIIFREEDDGAFLFDPETGSLKYMNRSAKHAFSMLNGQNDISQVIDHVAGTYPDVDRKQIQKDIESFLLELIESRFISSCKGE
jgi:hypothetical protein